MPIAMPSATSRLRRLGLALLLPALLMGAVAPSATDQSGSLHDSLTGQLLIATPDMRDPRFDHAVILIVKHDRDGALGVFINMPAGQRPLAELLDAIGETSAGIDTRLPVFFGGPVEPNMAVVLHSADYNCPGTLAIDGRVAMTADPQILRDIAAKSGPQRSLLAFGYAGWGPGQLDSEMAHNVWFTAPEDPALVFDAARDNVWDMAMARRTRDL